MKIFRSSNSVRECEKEISPPFVPSGFSQKGMKTMNEATYSILIIGQMLCEPRFTSFTVNRVPASETDNSKG